MKRSMISFALFAAFLLSGTACQQSKASSAENLDPIAMQDASKPRIGMDGGNQTQVALAQEPLRQKSGKDMSMMDFKTLPTCGQLRERAAAGESLDALFTPYFPAMLADDSVGTMLISDDDMRRVTAFLACSAQLNDWDASVPDAALNLFTSTRHKKAAYKALDIQAGATGEDAEAAKRFAEQMRNYNDGPNG